MKKIVSLIFLIMICVMLSPHAYAEDKVYEDLEESVDNQLDSLDFKEFDRFIKELNFDGFGSGVREYLEDILAGNVALDFTKLFSLMGEGVIKEIASVFPTCLSIILICILSSTLSSFSSKIANNATNNIVQFVCLSVVIILLISSTMNAVESVKKTVGLLGEFVNLVFPVLITLLTVIGGGSSVGVFSPYVGILSTLIINGVQNLIIPIFVACLTLSVVGNLTSSVKLGGIRRFLKTSSEWLLGLGFGIFCTLLGAQSIVSSSFDAVSVKSAKFALSSYVPVLGGYLSEGFDVVLAGSILIKNAIGLTGIIVILVITLLPLLKLILFTLALKLTSGVIESFSDQRVTDMLNAVASSMKILIAVLLGVAFLTFFVLFLMIYTVNAGVL